MRDNLYDDFNVSESLLSFIEAGLTEAMSGGDELIVFVFAEPSEKAFYALNNDSVMVH